MGKIVKIGELNNLDVYKIATGARYVHMRDYLYHLDNHFVDSYSTNDYGKTVEVIGKMGLVSDEAEKQSF